MSNRLTLITGASSGIGAVYADRLARRGHDLILVARDRIRLGNLAAKLAQDHSVRVETFPADLSDPGDLARVEARLRSDSAIGMLVNNAGILSSGEIAAADPDRLESVIRINVVAVTRLAAAAAASFAGRGRGTIVNIGSVTALMAESFEPTYLASKAYVLAFTQALHHQLAPHGVNVQAVLPGVTRTPILDGFDEAALPSEIVMDAGDMVDAALAGLEAGEIVTIPSLPDVSQWAALEQARLLLAPNLSRSLPAERYRVGNGRS